MLSSTYQQVLPAAAYKIEGCFTSTIKPFGMQELKGAKQGQLTWDIVHKSGQRIAEWTKKKLAKAG